jgi:hypothetical protein
MLGERSCAEPDGKSSTWFDASLNGLTRGSGKQWFVWRCLAQDAEKSFRNFAEIRARYLAAQQSATDRRRALELLAGSARQGCTEAFLLAHGFTVDLLADMVRAGLATEQIERVRAGGQSIEVTLVHITEANAGNCNRADP